MRDRGGRRVNDDYVEPAEFLRSLGSTIPASLIRLASFRLDRKSELSGMRASVDRVLAENGMHADARASCLVTVGELTANSFDGVPPVEVNLSRAGEHQLVLDVIDHGIGFDDPFFGYVVGSPEGLPTEGRGLWMVRHMCSSIEAATWPADSASGRPSTSSSRGSATSSPRQIEPTRAVAAWRRGQRLWSRKRARSSFLLSTLCTSRSAPPSKPCWTSFSASPSSLSMP